MKTCSWVRCGERSLAQRRIDLSRYSLHRQKGRVGGFRGGPCALSNTVRPFGRNDSVPPLQFLASKNNTNFLFRIDGEIDDALAAEFNGMFDARGGKQIVATARRMRLLKTHNCNLVFEKAVAPAARRNLAMVGGHEMAGIIAEMLRHYYYDGEGAAAYCSISDLVNWVATQNISEVEDLGDVEDVYWYQVSHLLYAMFTGMRLGSAWNGRSSVNGGYIVARSDGEVLAYHTCIADEFMDFLVQRLALEQPSHSRHLSMQINKDADGKFYIKLPLQIRFKAMKQNTDDTAE